jgi:hypothetical protein
VGFRMSLKDLDAFFEGMKKSVLWNKKP